MLQRQINGKPRAVAQRRTEGQSLEDLALVERCRGGDESAFAELVSRYEHKVYSLAFRMTGNHDDAQDLAQDVFVKVYHSLNRFRGEASFSTWLYRVASNVCLDSLRRRGRRPAVSLDAASVGDPSAVGDPRPGPQAAAEANEVQAALQAAIASLSPKHRAMVVLRDVQGMSYEEVAYITGCALGTVKSRLSRARESLRGTLSRSELFQPYLVQTDEARAKKGGEKP